ncbi:hypothetical protein GCM10010218_19750 [Streptomyces mashuensis]|uniref:DUF3168 domain-containing protein n=1 Tax=Streptomyces mashuensis TaxID=33904 RepID=A0A919B0U9_9ACTN|nr:hypothetical protein [Streptomyces mashuensis]GHF38619.1 hypothetical protein GCM10010218_19750 [Streptomyces mashuensis]
MRQDPVGLLVRYLRTVPEFREHVSGDLVGREPGQVTIYFEHSGGFRRVRDRADRSDIEYAVFHPDRGEAAALAFALREHLLERAPGAVVAGVQFLDVAEVSAPRYEPDSVSREHVYSGEIAAFYIQI